MVSVAITFQWQAFWYVFKIKVCSIRLDKQSFHVCVCIYVFVVLNRTPFFDETQTRWQRNGSGKKIGNCREMKQLHLREQNYNIKKQVLALPTKVNDPFANALQSKNVHNGSVLFTRNWSMYQFRWNPDHFFSKELFKFFKKPTLNGIHLSSIFWFYLNRPQSHFIQCVDGLVVLLLLFHCMCRWRFSRFRRFTFFFFFFFWHISNWKVLKRKL